MERFSPLEFSKMTGLGRKALRLYEAKGLLTPKKSGQGYRIYNQDQLHIAKRIVDLKRSGLSINEIKDALGNRNQIVAMKMVQSKIEKKSMDVAVTKMCLLANQMGIILATSVTEVQFFLQKNIGQWDKRYQNYLDREVSTIGVKRVIGLFNGGLLIANLCRENKWPMGPGRGATSASLILFGVGFHMTNPVEEGLLPERRVHNFQFHNDVDFKAGSEIFELVRIINELSNGEYQFTLFRMPILTIFKLLQEKRPFADQSIKENNWELKFWTEMKSGDFHFLFGLDEYNQSLIWRLYPKVMHTLDYNQELSHYLTQGHFSSFSDWPKWCALFRVHKEILVERLKIGVGELPQVQIPEEIQGEWRIVLEKQRGLILFHEQSIELISKYFGLNLVSASRLRVEYWKNSETIEWTSATRDISQNLKKYFEQQIPHTFCLAHLKAWGSLLRESAYWRTNFRAEYLQAISDFSQSTHPLWGDFGVDLGRMKLLAS